MNTPIKINFYKLESPESQKFIPIELSDDRINENKNAFYTQINPIDNFSFSKNLNFDDIEPIINNKETNEKNNFSFFMSNSLDNDNISFKDLLFSPKTNKIKKVNYKIENNNFLNNKKKCKTDLQNKQKQIFFNKKKTQNNYKFIHSIKLRKRNNSEKNKIKNKSKSIKKENKIKNSRNKTNNNNNNNIEKTKGKIIKTKSYNTKRYIPNIKQSNIEIKNTMITKLRNDYNKSVNKNKNPFHEVIEKIKKYNTTNNSSKKTTSVKRKFILKNNKTIKNFTPILTEKKENDFSFEFNEKNIFNTLNKKTKGRYCKLEKNNSNRIFKINSKIKEYSYSLIKLNKKLITKNSSRSHSKTSSNTNSTQNSNFLPSNKRKIKFFALSISSNKKMKNNTNNRNYFLNSKQNSFFYTNSSAKNNSNYMNSNNINNENLNTKETNNFKLDNYKSKKINSLKIPKGNFIDKKIKAISIKNK